MWQKGFHRLEDDSACSEIRHKSRAQMGASVTGSASIDRGMASIMPSSHRVRCASIHRSAMS